MFFDNKPLKDAQKLLAQNAFQDVLNTVSEYIESGNHAAEAYILKGKALEGLGRINEADTLFNNKIEWKYPSANDFEMIRLIMKSLVANNRCSEYEIYRFLYGVMMNGAGDEAWQENENKIALKLKELEEGPAKHTSYHDLAMLYLCRNEFSKAGFFLAAYVHFSTDNVKLNELPLFNALSIHPNFFDMFMYLSGQKHQDTFAFVVEREEDFYCYNIMAKTLAQMNKNVFLLAPAVTVMVKSIEESLESFLQLTWKNMEKTGNVSYVPSFLITENDRETENTILYTLYELAKNTNNHLPFFAEKATMDGLLSRRVKRHEIHYVFSGFDYKNAPSCTSFGYISGYEHYARSIFGIQIIENLNANSKYSFSIVLPVRNNIHTLGHTIRTCIEQDFKDYEIVISDNSDDGNNSVHDLVTQLGNDKISYFKTPRKLPVAKNFEYAYLKARGHFLVPIGADDGLLYNGLSTIHKILEKYPEEDIILWDRLHYVWPNFSYKPQSDQFVIPRPYISDNYPVKKVDSMDLLKRILLFPQSIYEAPLLYINSGMKRTYLLKLLEKTGTLLDGMSQDVYTGIANLAINKEILHIQYPVTIAALSSNSIGGSSLEGIKTTQDRQKFFQELNETNTGYSIQRNLEHLIPASHGDMANIFRSILRLIDMQCLDLEVLDYFDWRKAYKSIAEQLQENDMNFDSVLSRMLSASKNISEDLHEWFLEQIMDRKLRFMVINQDVPKSYHKGFSINSGLHMDASEFGIHNVYDAAQFARKLLNL